MKPEVTIYTKPGCPYCAAAMKYYTESAIPFKEISVANNPEVQATLLALTNGVKAVPVVIDHGELKVGFGGS
jgi:glutaredoxin 3